MKQSLHGCIRLVAVTAVFLTASMAPAQTPRSSDSNQADNTKMNKRDRAKDAPTADNQKSNTSDRDLTAQIRKAIIAEKSLSTYAHNVKIVTRGGMVTLKGPVRTDDEKNTVESKAKEIAGADKVTSQLSVAPAKKSSKSS